ncbi:DUF5719 family protein [Bifidobacterium parmae]|uniref:Organic solvents resistance ABC transporter permease n=1 Tax=Bifidobacterium parmae TaxID=361854 RepID=A0A2N5J5J7_9BIFI|nr:DUF5719 family protein [Bifidobacterium parmae]PLS29463.1 hypothetical protein Uis4E_0337 [Bifidobacterium parmae]
MNRQGTPMRVLRIIVAVVTSVLLLAAFALLAVVRMPDLMVDGASGTLGSSHRIVQEKLEAYCPARMQLPDSTDWGDSEYRASDGDIATSTALAAFGSVYASASSPLDLTGGAKTAALKAPTDAVSRDAMVLRDDGDYSRLLDTNLLKAGDGSGHAGVTVSHASDGDLRGIAAATCVTPAMSQSFLLTSTATGTRQQLVLANPSSKATTVSVTVVGSKDAGRMSLSTAGSATVAAESETVVDLSAAASGQDGLYVTVDSGAAPVGAVVRTTSSSGLTPKGSDFAMPTGDATVTNVIPGVAEGDAVRLYLYGGQAGEASLSWATDNGTKDIRKEQVKADRVAVIDLGKAPKGARGVIVSGGDHAFVASAKATRSGSGGQEDFALLQAAQPAVSSGMAIADGVDTTLTFINAGDEDATVKLTFMDGSGKAGDERDVTVNAHDATTVKGEGVAAVVSDENKTVSWGARITGGGLDASKTAGLSAVAPTTLAVREEIVRAVPDSSIVR